MERSIVGAISITISLNIVCMSLGGCSGGDEPWVNGMGMEMLHVAPSTFRMGPPRGERAHGPPSSQRTVTISSGFWLSRTEVSQGQWNEIMDPATPRFEGAELPIESIRWLDAVRFCNRLSEFEGRPPAYEIDGFDVRWDRSVAGYRLPTEAEWEYACRAGTTGEYASGDSLDPSHAHFDAPASLARTTREVRRGQRKSNAGSTTKVGSKVPNEWGFQDMHGNVWEYCWDWFGPASSGNGAASDPAGPSQGERRVVRGGSWFDEAHWCGCGNRQVPGPGSIAGSIGFRVALDTRLADG